MNHAPFDIPILLVMFNRPQHAAQVFEQIRAVKPTRLFITIDGPRINRPDDQANVAQCCDLLNGIDWPCELKTLIRKENLGCGKAVSSAIDWFFSHIEMGIILEDDCRPDTSFFTYCRELLYHHQHNPTVMHIGGVNYQNGIQRGGGSYYFTKICHVWGWATWRRAWSLYDYSMQSFPSFRQQQVIQQLLTEPEDQTYWLKAFQKIYDKSVDTWDYQWVYAVWTNNGLCALPNVNLVTNIGFDGLATHTKSKHLVYAEKETARLEQINHPAFIVEDKSATEHSLETQFRIKKGWQKKVDRLRLRIRYRTWRI